MSNHRHSRWIGHASRSLTGGTPDQGVRYAERSARLLEAHWAQQRVPLARPAPALFGR